MEAAKIYDTEYRVLKRIVNGVITKRWSDANRRRLDAAFRRLIRHDLIDQDWTTTVTFAGRRAMEAYESRVSRERQTRKLSSSHVAPRHP